MGRKKVPVDDVTELNKLSISLTTLRFQIAEMTRAGMTEIPLGDLILIIRNIHRAKVLEES